MIGFTSIVIVAVVALWIAEWCRQRELDREIEAWKRRFED